MKPIPLYWISDKTGNTYSYSEYDNADIGQGSHLKKNLPINEYPYTLVFSNTVENILNSKIKQIPEDSIIEYEIYGDLTEKLNGIKIKGVRKDVLIKLKNYRKISPMIGIKQL